MNLLRISQIIQVVVASGIIGLVLIQNKGSGLSSTFGGSISFYRTRRGVEKLVVFFTIFFGIVFVANSLLLIFLD